MADNSQAPEFMEIATQHYHGLKRQSVEVPEWGSDGQPLVIYYDPPSLAVRQKIEKRAKNAEGLKMALTVFYCAKDADGQRMFKQTDTASLNALQTEVDAAVVARIAFSILNITDTAELGN